MSPCPKCGKPSGHVGIVVPWKADQHRLDVLHSCLEHGIWQEHGIEQETLRRRVVENVYLLRCLMERILSDHAHAAKVVAETNAKMEALRYGDEWKQAQTLGSAYEHMRMTLSSLVMAMDMWDLTPQARVEAPHANKDEPKCWSCGTTKMETVAPGARNFVHLPGCQR